MISYIDTSILVAYYCPEALSESVQCFLSEQPQPAISSLTEVELFSSVSKKIRMNELNQLDGSRILSKFLSHLDAGFLHSSLLKPGIGDLLEIVSDKHLIQAATDLGVNNRMIN